MRIFITGAAGYIGSAVALAFRQHGHHVVGFIRDQEQANILRSAEIEPLVGNLENFASYSSAVESAEVLVHCAFESNAQGIERDAKTLDFLIAKAQECKRPRALLYTSGVWVYGNTPSCVDEASKLSPIDLVKWRPKHEEKVLESTTKYLRTVVLRPGCVYGGQGSLTSLWFESAKSGSVIMVGPGKNSWAMIHRQDLAEAFVLAAEKEVSNVILNVTDGQEYTVREMVELVAQMSGQRIGIKELSLAEAEKQYGAFIHGIALDQKVSSERAQRLLGWHPKHLGFVREINTYKASWK